MNWSERDLDRSKKHEVTNVLSWTGRTRVLKSWEQKTSLRLSMYE